MTDARVRRRRRRRRVVRVAEHPTAHLRAHRLRCPSHLGLFPGGTAPTTGSFWIKADGTLLLRNYNTTIGTGGRQHSAHQTADSWSQPMRHPGLLVRRCSNFNDSLTTASIHLGRWSVDIQMTGPVLQEMA